MSTAPATASFASSRRFHLGDAAFKGGLWAAAAIVLVTLGAILIILFQSGSAAFRKFGLAFLWSTDWDPVRDLYGALPAIVGTLATSAIALTLAWPIGFGIAYFLTETCPRRLRGPIGIAIELLAAIPSIVYGMWGFFVLAPVMSATIEPWLTEMFGFIPATGDFYWFQGAPLGVGLLTGGLVLAIMILPFIAAATRDVLLTTPSILKDGGYAMGATRWEVLTGVVVPAVRGSLFGAVFLALGRAMGETMAVTFVIGNANRIPDSLYAPAASIASIVANEFPDSAQGSPKLAALFALGFVLFVVSFFVLAVARLLLRQGRLE
ncbi:MAG TPA: phosphate ABC transporter permease subunit PstC [Caulobacterales bacterium]|jgi:phosphate transport system permease protein|nr:phosphate ABC transporter permease subunit PstC [Caulobacterales bacterium]